MSAAIFMMKRFKPQRSMGVAGRRQGEGGVRGRGFGGRGQAFIYCYGLLFLPGLLLRIT